MKKIIVALSAICSISSFAMEIRETVTIKLPQHLQNRMHISYKSNLDGVCKHLGFGVYVDGSLVKYDHGNILEHLVDDMPKKGQVVVINDDGTIKKIIQHGTGIDQIACSKY